MIFLKKNLTLFSFLNLFSLIPSLLSSTHPPSPSPPPNSLLSEMILNYSQIFLSSSSMIRSEERRAFLVLFQSCPFNELLRKRKKKNHMKKAHKNEERNVKNFPSIFFYLILCKSIGFSNSKILTTKITFYKKTERKEKNK